MITTKSKKVKSSNTPYPWFTPNFHA